MNIITILVTVIIINIYFRGPTTHTMPGWVRTVFLRYLPLFLMMHRPRGEADELHSGTKVTRKLGKRLSRDAAALLLNGAKGGGGSNRWSRMGSGKERVVEQQRIQPGKFIEMSRTRKVVFN
jgi:hypothetical protein